MTIRRPLPLLFTATDERIQRFRRVGPLAWVSVEVGAARFSWKLSLTYVILHICMVHVHADTCTILTLMIVGAMAFNDASAAVALQIDCKCIELQCTSLVLLYLDHNMVSTVGFSHR